jgi:hypothetical protein
MEGAWHRSISGDAEIFLNVTAANSYRLSK